MISAVHSDSISTTTLTQVSPTEGRTWAPGGGHNASIMAFHTISGTCWRSSPTEGVHKVTCGQSKQRYLRSRWGRWTWEFVFRSQECLDRGAVVIKVFDDTLGISVGVLNLVIGNLPPVVV